MIKGKKITDATSDDSPASLQAFSKNESRSRELGAYFVKACLLVVIVYLLSLALPKMPSPVVALFWVAFTLVSMLGILYQASIAKANRQQKFVAGGIGARFNNGRTFRLILSFVVSAMLMASLLLETPRWNVAEWLFIVAAVVVYPLVEIVVRWRIPHEYETIFQTAGEMLWTSILVGVLLCVGYGLCSWLGWASNDTQEVATLFDAFAKTPQPLDGAISPLLQESGIGSWMADSIVNFGMAQISQQSWYVCLAIRVLLCAGAFFGIANLLAVCSLPLQELRKSFIPTDAIKNGDAKAHVRARYIVCTVVLSALLVGGFLFCDAKTNEAMQTEGGTALQLLARQLAGKSVYVIDGTYYDQAKIDALDKSIASEKADFVSAASAVRGAADSAYDACEGNIDAFLDWYFSIATNSSLRQSISKDDARQTLEDKFESVVASGEDERLTQALKVYRQAAQTLKNDIENGYRDAELDGAQYEKLPVWFVESKEFTDAAELDSYRQKAERALNAFDESGISNALDGGQMVLELQFDRNVYSDGRFGSMVSSVEDIAGQGNIASDAFNYVKGMFDKGTQYDGFRSNIEEMLAACRSQTEMLTS